MSICTTISFTETDAQILTEESYTQKIDGRQVRNVLTSGCDSGALLNFWIGPQSFIGIAFTIDYGREKNIVGFEIKNSRNQDYGNIVRNYFYRVTTLKS